MFFGWLAGHLTAEKLKKIFLNKKHPESFHSAGGNALIKDIRKE